MVASANICKIRAVSGLILSVGNWLVFINGNSCLKVTSILPLTVAIFAVSPIPKI